MGVSLLLWLSAGSGHGTRSHALASRSQPSALLPPPPARGPPPTAHRSRRRDAPPQWRPEPPWPPGPPGKGRPLPGPAAPRVPRRSRIPRRGPSAEQQNPALLRGNRAQAEVKPGRTLSGGTEPLPGAGWGQPEGSSRRFPALGSSGCTPHCFLLSSAPLGFLAQCVIAVCIGLFFFFYPKYIYIYLEPGASIMTACRNHG